MKSLILLTTLLIAATLLAEDLTTLSGEKYTGVTVKRVEADSLSISHDDGLAKIPFTDLSDEVRKKYNYDPQKAAAFMKQKADAAAQRQQAAVAAQIQAERDAIVKNTKTIREVETDQLAFLDKPFFLDGTIEVSNYYNYGYDNAEGTHYSFQVDNDDYRSCHVFMERSKAAALRKQILDAGGKLKGLFSVVILKARYESPGEVLAELLDYRPPLK